MLIWIFDLDETLYHLDKPFEYRHLKTDKYLDFMLSMLPGKKFIFTNATYMHAITCLNIIGIMKHFNGIESRDTLNGLKPNPVVFQKFINKRNISSTDTCLFFEDTISNLNTAKTHFKWKTIYVGNNEDENKENIDFKFKNIHNCLEFFVKNLGMKVSNY